MLFECLQLSEGTACWQKSRCDRNVALHILLKILSFLYRCKDLVPLFELNPAESLIFTLNFIYQGHHHRLEPWNFFFLQPSY